MGKLTRLAISVGKKHTCPVIFDIALQLITKHQHQQILSYVSSLKKKKQTWKGQVKQDSLLH